MTKQTFTAVVNDTESRMMEIEAYKNKPISGTPQKIGFFVLVAIGLLMASLFVFQILTGIFALIMMGVTAVGFWLGWQYVKRLDPIIQQKSRNWQLKKLIEQARKEAVYQLDNQVLDRHQKLKSAREARDKMGALVMGMKDKINRGDPTSPSIAKMQGILSKVQEAYDTVLVNLDKAKIANEEFEQKVQEYKDLDTFSQMAGEAMGVFDSSANGKLQEMLSLEAFKHIDSEFNTAIISIENSARDGFEGK
jgi:hypothetical protein